MKPILLPSPAGHLTIWDDPVEGLEYVIGVDVAEGRVRDMGATKLKPHQLAARDDRPDYSAAIVLELNTGQHVASWHGDMEAIEYAATITAMALYYNEAQLAVEINGPGLAVIEHLVKVLRYWNVYESKVWNRIDGSTMGHEFGWRTTQVTRPLLIARIQEVLSNDSLFTRDRNLVRELRTMVYDPRGVPRAMNRDKDDRVLALAIALQARFEKLYNAPHQEREHKSRLDSMDAETWKRVKERIHDRQLDRDAAGARDARPRVLNRLAPKGR